MKKDNLGGGGNLNQRLTKSGGCNGMEAHLLGIKATGLTFNEDPMTISRSV